jgi:hypothetical protein
MTLALAFIAFMFTYLILILIFNYYGDVKGFRKYPNLFPASDISNLPMILEARNELPSKARLEAHKSYHIDLIGPNSLFFCDSQAIKDVYGQGTKCIKDSYYDLIFDHYCPLFDVDEKSDHAQKRKMMSGGRRN